MLNIETTIELLEKLHKEEIGSTLAQFFNVDKSIIGDIKRKNNYFIICVKVGLDRWQKN